MSAFGKRKFSLSFLWKTICYKEWDIFCRKRGVGNRDVIWCQISPLEADRVVLSREEEFYDQALNLGRIRVPNGTVNFFL